MNDVADLSAAYRAVSLADKGGSMEIELQVFCIGGIAFVGIPGEIFSDIGRRVKDESPCTHTFISALTNGSYGYFPTHQAFEEGGYEAKNNPFTPELEDIVVGTAVNLLKRCSS